MSRSQDNEQVQNSTMGWILMVLIHIWSHLHLKWPLNPDLNLTQCQ